MNILHPFGELTTLDFSQISENGQEYNQIFITKVD